MNSQTFFKASPPIISAGPILRAGLTDVPVNLIPNKWTSVKESPITMPAIFSFFLSFVTPSTVKTKTNVK